MKKHLFMVAAVVLALVSCSGSSEKHAQVAAAEKEAVDIVKFNADSAYKYVAAQCAFGERVPNTEAHRRCGDYLVAELKRHGAVVTEQMAKMVAYDGTVLNVRNIVGEFYPDKPRRILLLAHWDCRPWADNDPDPKNRLMPVMGANDGASGVGVLLEIARILSKAEPQAGVDILFTDAEDWGEANGDNEDSWALGTQYWVKNPHRDGYQYPAFGILLDMVGDKDARFLKEYFSMQSAGAVVDKLWSTAASLGYGDRFVDAQGGAMTDDHVFLIKAGIPCVDIIDQRTNSSTGFCRQWHTADDTMSHIDRQTLEAVGQTVVSMLLGR